MTQANFAYEEEIVAFNQSQTAKIVSIRKKRMKNQNAKKKAFEQFKGLLFSITIVLFFTGLFGSVIYQSSLVSEAKYDIFNLKAEIKSLVAKQEELHAKIENQTELSNIENIAMEKLDMQYPTQEQMVYIETTYTYELPMVASASKSEQTSAEAFVSLTPSLRKQD